MSNAVNPGYKYIPENFPDSASLFEAIKGGDRVALAKAITLVESRHPRHQQARFDLLKLCAAHPTQTIRLGITGVPGAGKSTMIEALGQMIIGKGHRLAVLAIDPSSSKSKGSILGDKTRMQTLSTNPAAYIRPTASAGNLGGTAAYTREVIQVCEAAGFDFVIVETVGVGQSETMVHGLTDAFVLLAVPGTGDELQGIKRGIMEMADIIAINKSDGDNITRARQAATQIKNALHLFPVGENEWLPRVLNVSALEKTGLADLLQTIENYIHHTRANGSFDARRKAQEVRWLDDYIVDMIREQVMQGNGYGAYEALKAGVLGGDMSAMEAAAKAYQVFKNLNQP